MSKYGIRINNKQDNELNGMIVLFNSEARAKYNLSKIRFLDNIADIVKYKNEVDRILMECDGVVMDDNKSLDIFLLNNCPIIVEFFKLK